MIFLCSPVESWSLNVPRPLNQKILNRNASLIIFCSVLLSGKWSLVLVIVYGINITTFAKEFKLQRNRGKEELQESSAWTPFEEEYFGTTPKCFPIHGSIDHCSGAAFINIQKNYGKSRNKNIEL